jgi:hypothetical protein
MAMSGGKAAPMETHIRPRNRLMQSVIASTGVANNKVAFSFKSALAFPQRQSPEGTESTQTA